MSERPRLTHVAFPVNDMDASIDFYRRFARLNVVHERVDDGVRVVWLSEQAKSPRFVLVLIETQVAPDRNPTFLRHLGYDVPSRAAVDEVAARADAAGVLVHGPADGGLIVGYFCILRDPDGNFVELSHGQPIDPAQLGE